MARLLFSLPCLPFNISVDLLRCAHLEFFLSGRHAFLGSFLSALNLVDECGFRSGKTIISSHWCQVIFVHSIQLYHPNVWPNEIKNAEVNS